MSKAPIDPKDYLHGVTVVQIEDVHVSRGMTRRPPATCSHQQLLYDEHERRVWCSDCETEVEAFDAFTRLVQVFSAATDRLQRRSQALAETETFQLRSRAAKVMDEAWRRTSTVPLCPHCKTAIRPEDVVAGLAHAAKHRVKKAQ